METTTESIYRGMQEIFSDVFERRDIVARPDLRAADVEGWDSFKFVEILIASEERWDIAIPFDDVNVFQRLEDLVKAIHGQIILRGDPAGSPRL
jgi:acyl carrier protein